MTEPELDRELAARLRAAAEQEPYAVLDDAARARVLQALVNEPVQRRRSQLWVNLGMAVAAAALLALMLRPAGPACALPADAAFQGSSLELGRFGRVVLASGAQAQLSKREACELEITLTHGTLAAALHDLKPGRLRVRTSLGAVEVRGTTFSVAVEQGLEVVLLEGAVALHDGETITALAPGHTLTRGGPHDEAATSEVAPAQAHALRRLLSLEPAPAQAAEPSPEPLPVVAEREDEQGGAASEPARGASSSATELLAEAERERRAGALAQARALYRQAGAAPGADAEVALLRWARLELEQQPDAALLVLDRYRARYGRKLGRARLAAEASFLEVQVLDKLGRTDEARQRAHELVRRYPSSPYAAAAAAW